MLNDWKNPSRLGALELLAPSAPTAPGASGLALGACAGEGGTEGESFFGFVLLFFKCYQTDEISSAMMAAWFATVLCWSVPGKEGKDVAPGCLTFSGLKGKDALISQSQPTTWSCSKRLPCSRKP